MRSVLAGEVASVEEALDEALDGDVGALSRQELAEAVLAVQRLRAKVDALGARVVGVFDAEAVWADRGAVNAQTGVSDGLCRSSSSSEVVT